MDFQDVAVKIHRTKCSRVAQSACHSRLCAARCGVVLRRPSLRRRDNEAARICLWIKATRRNSRFSPRSCRHNHGNPFYIPNCTKQFSHNSQSSVQKVVKRVCSQHKTINYYQSFSLLPIPSSLLWMLSIFTLPLTHTPTQLRSLPNMVLYQAPLRD